MTEENSLVISSGNELQTSSSTLIRRGLSLLEKKAMKVLLLDDEEAMRYCYKVMLQKQFSEKYALIIFESDGEDALEIFRRENDIDLVISDIRHPKHNGIEHAKMFRNERAEIKIILASASQGGSHIQELLRTHIINVFLPKPFKEEDFVKAVEKVMRGAEIFTNKQELLSRIAELRLRVSNLKEKNPAVSEEESSKTLASLSEMRNKISSKLQK